MGSIDIAGVMAGASHFIEVMDTNPYGATLFVIGLVLALWVWRNPRHPQRPPGRKKRAD